MAIWNEDIYGTEVIVKKSYLLIRLFSLKTGSVSNGSVYMVSFNGLKNFLQLNEKRIFQALSFDEKFQNFRRV